MPSLNRDVLTHSRARFVRLSDHIRAILDTIREPFVVLDAALRIRLVNKAFCSTFLLSAKKINGQTLYSLGEGAWETRALRTWLDTVLARKTLITDFEVEGYFPGLGQRAMMFNARLVDIPGAKQILLLTIDDMTVRKQAEQALGVLHASLKNETMTDELTGLYNRRGYDILSQIYLDLAQRRSKRIFVIYADLDGLKQINDQAGHQAGDQVITRAADILRKTFRKSDIIARLGGDEFAIATIENGHDSAATQVARLHLNIKRHATKNGYRKPIAMSVGVARSNPLGTSSMQELTTQADALMYIEKRGKHKGDTMKDDEKELSKVGQGYNDARGEIPDKKDIPKHNGQNVNNDPAHHRANEKVPTPTGVIPKEGTV